MKESSYQRHIDGRTLRFSPGAPPTVRHRNIDASRLLRRADERMGALRA